MPSRPLLERFEEKYILDAGGCWLWTAAKDYNGYGVIRTKDSRAERTHRVSYKLFVGPIPKGIFVCHRCDNPSCVNPEHLFLGSQADNIRDMISKNRQKDSRGIFNGRNKLNEDQVRAIRTDNRIHRKVAADYNIAASTVKNIKKRYIWKDIP